MIVDDTGRPAYGAEHKLVIELLASALPEICDAVEAALAARDREIFQYDGALYWKPPHGVLKLDVTLLRLRAMRVVRFVKYSRRLGLIEAEMPTLYCRTILAKRHWSFPVLDLSNAVAER